MNTPPPHPLAYETRCNASWQIHSSGMVQCRTCSVVLQAGGTPKCLQVVEPPKAPDLSKIPQLTHNDIVDFVARHEFNELGEEEWFRLVPYKGAFREPATIWSRRFEPEQVLMLAVGLDKEFRARPIDSLNAAVSAWKKAVAREQENP